MRLSRPCALLLACAGAAAATAAEQSVAAEPRDTRPAAEGERALAILARMPGPLLPALEEELTAMYLRLAPSLVEVRCSFREDGAAREIVAAGVVLSADGFVVAPIYRAEDLRIAVRRTDGEGFVGELVAHDARYGLALLKVEGLRGMQPRLFPGEFVMEGAPVIALGNAFGLEASMSLGILTGKGRIAGEARRLLQVTNAVNPGDGGGLLANAHGFVIGILMNSLPDLARAGVPVGMEDGARGDLAGAVDPERARHASGIGFAVPVEVVLGLFPEQLGHLLRRSRMLGVEVMPRLLIAETPAGPQRGWRLEIVTIVAGSAAEAAGLRPGDLFVQLDGRPVTTLEELGGAIFGAPERTQATVLRGEETLQLPVDFASRPLPPPPPEED